MAAIQKIRSYSLWLMAIVGLALFAFIAEPLFESFKTLVGYDSMQVGSVYGKSFSVQDYQNEVNDRTEMAKITKAMRGQADALTAQEEDQIRETTWREFVTNAVIEHEADKLGIEVTDGDEQDALRQGQYPSLQLLAQLGFANQQGVFDANALQDFIKNYDKSLKQAVANGQQQYAEQYQQLRRIWEFSEKQLRREILQQKYATLLQSTFISNPIAAKQSFDEQTQKADVEIVAVPYSTVPDKDVKVSDAELQDMYAKNKEMFRLTAPFAILKVLDVEVKASEADKAALMKEVQNWQQQLQDGVDPTTVVGGSKTNFAYSTLPMSKKAFQSIPDVAAGLDSMAVGAVKPAYYNAQDNTITTYKLINKVQAADSVLYRSIVAVAETPEKSAARADSIMKAIEGGKSFTAMAKELNQPTDSVWSYSAQYEQRGLPADEASVIAQLNTMEPGVKVLSTSQGSIVFQVLERRNIEAKYNVAVVKCPLNFSKATYNTALNKLNKFRASNTTFAAFEKNAAKAGYTLSDSPLMADNLALHTNPGGSAAKDAMKWVFDDAKAGDVSKIYECGRENNHLLVLGVKSITTDEYMPLDNDDVKKVITSMVQQQKKAEKLMAQLKGVKDINAAKAQKGAVAEELKEQTFYSTTMLQAIGVPEPKLAGAIARTQQGKFSGAVQGAAAIYFVQVQSKTAGTEKYDEKIALEQASSALAQNVMRTIIPALAKDAKVRDQRYKF